MLRNINGWQLFIIIFALIVLIGWKRLPDAARSLGRSMRIFKSEVEQMGDKDDRPSAASSDTVDTEPRRGSDPLADPVAGDQGRAGGPPGAAHHDPGDRAGVPPEDGVHREGPPGDHRP